MDKATEILPVHTLLIDDIKQIINHARNQVAVNVNAELTLMYWHIGERINRELLRDQRAEYGRQIVSAVSRQLQVEYGEKGFETRSIWRMMQFAVHDRTPFQGVAATSDTQRPRGCPPALGELSGQLISK